MAIVGTHLLRGSKLDWLPIADTPLAVWAESEGPDDDLRLEFDRALTVEIQTKKGLERGRALWNALEAPMKAVIAGDLDYGLLAVAPDSSGSVREYLSRDIERLGQGREDYLTEIGKDLHQRVKALSGDWVQACQRIRIRVVHAIPADDADIRAAKERLRSICVDEGQVDAAWSTLHNDALAMIETRGRWTADHLVTLFRKNGIELRDIAHSAPSIAPHRAQAQLCRHVIASNRSFSIFGVTQPLSMDTGWIDLPIFVPMADESPEPATVDEILELYRNGRHVEVHPAIAGLVNISIGRFYRHCVVIGGPGLGKSMLTRKLALAYARDSFPVIKVDLKALALAMRQGGTFLGNLLTLGLEDAGVSPDAIKPAFLASGVLLCDGLDEAGSTQDLIAQHLATLAESHPGCRVVVTTRPIGYETSYLANWRHYEICALDSYSADTRIERLLTGIHPNEPDKRRATQAYVQQQLERNHDSDLTTHNPLLLGLCVLLGMHREEFGSSRNELYARVFGRIERTPSARIDVRPLASLATRCVDVLGWVLTTDPDATLSQVRAQCAEVLAEELGTSQLKAEMEFEQCLAFWQQTGMIERVHHAGEDMLLFVHKTLGEFAGARYLADIRPAAVRDALILAQAQHTTSMELLRFAGGLGLADSVVRALLRSTDGGAAPATKILHCLAILADGTGELPAALIADILNAIFVLARSTPEAAGFICPTLLRATKHYPDAIAERARALRDDPQNWTRLIAWACLATAGSRHYDLDALVATFLNLPDLGMHPEDFGPPPGSTDRDDIQDLAIAFATAAFGEILSAVPTERSNAILATLIPKISAGPTPPPVEFTRQAMALLRAVGRNDDGERLFERWLIGTPGEKERQANQNEQVLKIVIDLLVDGMEKEPNLRDEHEPSGPFIHLGAFLEATDYLFAMNNEAENWQQPYDREAARATIQALVSLSGVDLAALRMDALRFRAEITHQPDATLARGRTLGGRIDISPIDYTAAQKLDLPPSLIEKAKRHPSTWIAAVAARIYDNIKA